MSAKSLNGLLLGACIGILGLSSAAVAAVELQSERVQLSSSRIETDTVECYRHRADLDIVIGNPRDKSSNSMRISLKNFRSVEHNTEAAELAFTIDDSTVGTVRVQTPEHTWHVHPAAAANSRCQITVDRGANGTLDIQTKCRDLVPAARLTLEKMSQQTLQAALGKPIRCSISE